MNKKIDEKDVKKIMEKIFKGHEIEKGHKTTGHKCVDKPDIKKAQDDNASILYGEILPEGLERALDSNHLDIKNSKVVYDLGAGLCKSIIRIWLSNHNINRAVGIELFRGRYKLAEKAVLRLVKYYKNYKILEHTSNCLKIMDISERILAIKNRNLFNDAGSKLADIIICNTDFPNELIDKLTQFLADSKKKCKIMTYKKLKKHKKINQMEINKDKTDVFLSSWNKETNGHHFYMWIKK